MGVAFSLYRSTRVGRCMGGCELSCLGLSGTVMQCGGLPSSYLMAHGASSVAKDLGEKAGSAEGLSLWLICFVQKNCRGKSLKGWPTGQVLSRDLLNTFLARIDGTFHCSICAWTCC